MMMFICIKSLNLTVMTCPADPGQNLNCDAISNNKSTVCGAADKTNQWPNQFTWFDVVAVVASFHINTFVQIKRLIKIAETSA